MLGHSAKWDIEDPGFEWLESALAGEQPSPQVKSAPAQPTRFVPIRPDCSHRLVPRNPISSLFKPPGCAIGVLLS